MVIRKAQRAMARRSSRSSCRSFAKEPPTHARARPGRSRGAGLLARSGEGNIRRRRGWRDRRHLFHSTEPGRRRWARLQLRIHDSHRRHRTRRSSSDVPALDGACARARVPCHAVQLRGQHERACRATVAVIGLRDRRSPARCFSTSAAWLRRCVGHVSAALPVVAMNNLTDIARQAMLEHDLLPEFSPEAAATSRFDLSAQLEHCQGSATCAPCSGHPSTMTTRAISISSSSPSRLRAESSRFWSRLRMSTRW